MKLDKHVYVIKIYLEKITYKFSLATEPSIISNSTSGGT